MRPGAKPQPPTQFQTRPRSDELAAALLSLSQMAHAQNRLKAAVPFDFGAGRASMRAGECYMNVQSSPALAKIDCGGQSMGIALTRPLNEKAATTSARLVFRRYGNHYFLHEIWPG